MYRLFFVIQRYLFSPVVCVYIMYIEKENKGKSIGFNFNRISFSNRWQKMISIYKNILLVNIMTSRKFSLMIHLF